MAVVVPSREEGVVVPSPVTAAEAAALRADDVLARLGSGTTGLAEDEAARRLRVVGPNAVRSQRVHAWSVLASQLRSPLLILLAVTALASAFLGQASDAVIIGVILAASVGMGFVNEYKAAKTAEALHSSVRHSCVTLRGGHPRTVDVTELVPGDVVDLQLGQVAGVLTGAIFVINFALHKPVIDALLFSLSIAVGISPQLLPAVVSTSLAAGSRQLAQRKVLVKRLVCIEDLGDIDVLFTDKTCTLTEGSLRFMRSAGPDGGPVTSRCCWGCCATRR